MPPFHPCGFSPQSISLCLCLISIHVTSHLHPGPQNCISAPYKHPRNPIKDSRYVSHLHLVPISSGSGSKDFSLTSIHVLSQPNPGPYSHITPPSRQCLKSIQFLIFMCNLNPGHVSPPPRSEDIWYTSINALSHLQPGHSPRLLFTSTHVLISASHHHPGDVSPPSKSWNLHLSSVQVLSQSHLGFFFFFFFFFFFPTASGVLTRGREIEPKKKRFSDTRYEREGWEKCKSTSNCGKNKRGKSENRKWTDKHTIGEANMKWQCKGTTGSIKRTGQFGPRQNVWEDANITERWLFHWKWEETWFCGGRWGSRGQNASKRKVQLCCVFGKWRQACCEKYASM